jgi:polysaccharide biosynthesis transport protein
MDKAPTAQPAGSILETSANLRHYWHVVLERRWLVITAFISVMLLTAIYLFKATPIYEATVRIQIDRESGNVLNVKDVISAETREQDYLQTQYKNLTSRTLLDSVFKDLKLDKDPRYEQAQDKVFALSQDITIAPIRLSRLVDVRVEHSDRKQAQAIANKLADLFVKQNLEQKVQSSFDAVSWLRTQVEDSKKNVSAAEQALLEYRKDNNEVSLEEGENIARQGLLAAQESLNRLRAEAVSAAKSLEEIDRLIAAGQKLESIPAIAQSLTVQRLRQELAVKEATLAALLKRYRDKFPAVIAARSEITKLSESLQQEAQSQLNTLRNNAKIVKQQEEAVANMLKQEEQKQFALNNLRIKYDVLKRDAENNKTIHNNVLMRMKETELMSRMNSNNMRVVDPATTPLRPIKPRVVVTVLLGIIGGMGVALGLAFFVSYLDDSVKSQDDVETYLRLPFLGYVPNIKTNSVVERDLQAHLHPQSNAAEGFRTIRATVALSPRAEKYRVLAITSTIPSEGKSLVASNLAIVTAQTGLKTLLVDADLRRPSVHKAYQLHSPIGLSGYLTREIDDLDELIHQSEVPNLDVICCGAVPSTPSELIGSTRMMEFLEKVKGKYDRVVLDCPPVSAVSDPLIISAMSDGVVYVTKFNKIRREHARKSVARIQNAGIHIVGLVVNDIDFEGKDSYYYSYYYYQNRYYSSYKTNPSETKDTAEKVKA